MNWSKQAHDIWAHALSQGSLRPLSSAAFTRNTVKARLQAAFRSVC